MKHPPVQIVWFKRDLRIHDHKPLWEAAQRGPVLPLYIVEPNILHADDFDPAHWTFIHTSIVELRRSLALLGQPLIVRVGNAVQTLRSLSRQVPVAHLWAHEETGNLLTFERDIAVRHWATTAGIPFTELPQNGVVRRLRDRDQWESLHNARMREKQTPTPEALEPVSIMAGRIPDHKQLKLVRDRRTGAQPGGERTAGEILNDFLRNRGDGYLRGLARPVNAPDLSSRLSPHLAYGTLSLRRAIQGTRRRLYQVQREKEPGFDKKQWANALKAFESRLHWRSHFMQKLEDEPEIEKENFVRSLTGVREGQFNSEWFERWCAGQTGYPLVDAAMRSLAVTGWLNFRMRAMVVSFASYDLWLHWREPALHLARAFVDYEPGIHYSQMQMQSGTTGINTMRVYDPTKQALERDPNGEFIRKWVPELEDVPELFVHEPWRMPPSVQESVGVKIGRIYPPPIVDHAKVAPVNRERLYRARRTPDAVAESRAVLEKHGSRRNTGRGRRKPSQDSSYQLEFGLGLDV